MGFERSSTAGRVSAVAGLPGRVDPIPEGQRDNLATVRL